MMKFEVAYQYVLHLPHALHDHHDHRRHDHHHDRHDLLPHGGQTLFLNSLIIQV